MYKIILALTMLAALNVQAQATPDSVIMKLDDARTQINSASKKLTPACQGLKVYLNKANQIISSAQYDLTTLDQPTPDQVIGYFATLQEQSVGRLYGGEASTSLQARQNAYNACLQVEFSGNCALTPTNVIVKEIWSSSSTVGTICSFTSGTAHMYTAKGRTENEATLKAHKSCLSVEFSGNCKTTKMNVVCEKEM